jgi:hypothetical protein
MAANRFYRGFVTRVIREAPKSAVPSAVPEGASEVAAVLRTSPNVLELKDLYVGKREGTFVKPWVTTSALNYYCVSTPGDGYRCEIAPDSGKGYRQYRYI